MTTTTIFPTPGRPTGGATARLFRWALTCPALAFGLLAPLPAHAGDVAGDQTLNFPSAGTVSDHGYVPEDNSDGFRPAQISGVIALSPAPTLTANFVQDKVLALIWTAPAGKRIRFTPPPGAGESAPKLALRHSLATIRGI